MQLHRPNTLIGVLGTRTEIGKTWVTVRLLATWRHRGHTVAARKPVQSFEPGDVDTDAALLAAVTGDAEQEICPPHRRYARAMAPPMAADLLGEPRISIQELASEIVWPANIDVGVVETVGGPRSPIGHDGDSIDLLNRLEPDLQILVADAGLGTLNDVRLSLACVSFRPTLVFLNRYDDANDLHRLNRRWLEEKYSADLMVEIDALAERCYPTATSRERAACGARGAGV